MRLAHYTLIAGIVLGVVGFSVAAFLGDRQLGMTIFMIGFFVGAVSAVCIAITSAKGDFGKIGFAIKVAAGGFSMIVLGQLAGFLFDGASLIVNTFFFIGLAVMLVGVLAAAVRMAKP